MTIVTRRTYSVNAPPPSERVREAVSDWRTVYEALLLDRRLRRSGKWLVTTCPLHPDRNPSFGIRPDTGRWTCFAGCGSGDAFALAMKLRGIPFGEAVRLIAQIAGVPVDTPRPRFSHGRGRSRWR